MDYKARDRAEPFPELTDDLEIPKLVRDEEQTEYKAEAVEDLHVQDFSSPEIADAFIGDRLAVVTAKLREVGEAISKNYLMRSNYVQEIDEEITLDQGELNRIRELNFQASRIIASRLRDLEKGVQDLRKRKRDTKEHFTDKIFSLKMEGLDLMPDYLALKRIKGRGVVDIHRGGVAGCRTKKGRNGGHTSCFTASDSRLSCSQRKQQSPGKGRSSRNFRRRNRRNPRQI
jgi:hypothetical protein